MGDARATTQQGTQRGKILSARQRTSRRGRSKAPDDNHIRDGDFHVVAVRDIVSRPELNGQLGGAVSHDPRTGRYAVALDEGASDVKMSIKVRAANLEAAD